MDVDDFLERAEEERRILLIFELLVRQEREAKGEGEGEAEAEGEGGEEEEQEEEEVVQEPEVEVAKPELTTNLSGSVTYKVGDTAKALTVEATTSDGGTITYQWYQSSTNKNRGGTPIDGATENTYVPSTKEEGTMYYYAVATSTIGNSSNGVTSDTAEVIVSSAEDTQENEGQEQAADSEGETENTQENTQEKTQEDAQKDQG